MNQEALLSDYKSEGYPADAEWISDLLLLKHIAANDGRAFSELYGRYSLAIYNYLVHMIFDQPASEDLLQEIFLSVWKGAGRFRGQASVKTWIYRIAHHQTVSWLRRNRRVVLMDSLEETSFEHDPEKIYQVSSNYQALREALIKLSPEHKEVLELAFYHGMSYAEISEVMECPIGTVKSRMSHARRRIVRLLQEQDISI